MPLTDTDITDWQDDYTGADTNTPTDSQQINGQLDNEVRNIKSVVRAESLAKQWEKHGLTPTYVSATSFTLEGDQRNVAISGRRLKATCNSRTIYGVVDDSSYTSNTTTVNCIWGLVKFTDATINVKNATTLYVSGNFVNTDYFGATQTVELWNASNERMPGRWTVANASFVSSNTELTFSFPGTATEIDFTVFSPTTMLWRGYPEGINSNVSEVQWGPYTPDTFQSGLPHRAIGGTFNVVMSGTAGPFTVNFPVNADTDSPISLHTTSYVLQLQPVGIVSGSPNTNAWANAYVSARTASNFNITLSAAVDTGTVQYDYYVCLGN